MRMYLVQVFVVFKIEFPGRFEQLILTRSLVESLHSGYSERVERPGKHLNHVEAIDDDLSFREASSNDILIVKI